MVTVLGDNLETHHIGGFSENFSSVKHWCCYCDVCAEEFHRNPFHGKTVRTIDEYNTCVSEAIKHRSVVKGIKGDSALNKLENYHASKPGLPPCVAHDLFKGIVLIDMFLTINYFVQRKWFRLSLLNLRMNNVRIFGKKEYIPLIKKNKMRKLSGTASQMRRSLQIFPVIMSDCIRDYQVWQNQTVFDCMCPCTFSRTNYIFLKCYC